MDNVEIHMNSGKINVLFGTNLSNHATGGTNGTVMA